ncbi:MAG: hypothetical protein ACUVUG_08620 [Candidatus Aminicenantia bacterium]
MEKIGTVMFLYFGLTGLLSLVFLVLTIYFWAKKVSLIEDSLRNGSRWKLMGYIFLFLGALFICGVIWKPGALIYKNPDFKIAIPILLSAKGFFLVGWFSLLIGEIKAYKFFLSKRG